MEGRIQNTCVELISNVHGFPLCETETDSKLTILDGFGILSCCKLYAVIFNDEFSIFAVIFLELIECLFAFFGKLEVKHIGHIVIAKDICRSRFNSGIIDKVIAFYVIELHDAFFTDILREVTAVADLFIIIRVHFDTDHIVAFTGHRNVIETSGIESLFKHFHRFENERIISLGFLFIFFKIFDIRLNAQCNGCTAVQLNGAYKTIGRSEGIGALLDTNEDDECKTSRQDDRQ